MSVKSIYYNIANKSIDWLPMDTEQLYKTNLIKNYNKLKRYGWIDKQFTYKFNSHGFRCEEFTEDPTVITLGCSFTVGIGLPVSTIWPELVAKKLNLKCANLGQGGHGPDMAFNLCKFYIDIVKPKIVVYMESPPYRLSFLDHSLNINLYKANDKNYSDFYGKWISNDINNSLHYEKNLLAIEMMCKKRNIKFINTKYDALTSSHDSLARDLEHCGIENHAKFATELLEKIG